MDVELRPATEAEHPRLARQRDAVEVYRRLGFAPDEALMQIEWQK